MVGDSAGMGTMVWLGRAEKDLRSSPAGSKDGRWPLLILINVLRR